MPPEWFDNNPENYLVKNKEDRLIDNRTKGDNLVDKTKYPKYEELKDIDWKDIDVVVDGGDGRKSYKCSYKEHKIMDLEVFNSDKYDNFNRIHTMGLMPIEGEYHKGIGLGYKCYKAVINKIGWARSSEYRTNVNSRKIWGYLIKDKDYYVVETFAYDGNYDDDDTDTDIKSKGFMVFKKNMKISMIKKILDNFKKRGGEIVSLDPGLSKI